MSLASIITSSQSLQNIETQIGVVSNNVSNSQNANYVARNTSTVSNATGSAIVDVSRQVNATLQQEMFSQSAVSSGSGLVSSFYTQLEQLTGSATGSPTLAGAASSLVTAFQNFATTPESGSTQNSVIRAAENLVTTVKTLSSGVETIAGQVQTQAQTDVKTVNADLTKIAQINNQIQTTKALEKSSADLEDQRDTVLNDLATYLPIKTVTNDDGTVAVSTPDGISLVSGAQATQFNYNSFILGSGGVQGTNPSITIVGDSSNTSLNRSFSSGKIGAELNILRVDDAGAASTSAGVAPLEKVRRQLDSVADQFYSSVSGSPTAIQSAYDSATIGTGELAASLFTVTGQNTLGSPQTAGDDRDNFQVNSALTAGTSKLKIASANAVLTALTSTTSISGLTSGDVTNFSGTITSLSNTIAAAQTNRASAATAVSDQDSTTLSSVKSGYASSTGVSVDTELSNLIVLQNSYNATAKVISVANTMFQALVSAVS